MNSISLEEIEKKLVLARNCPFCSGRNLKIEAEGDFGVISIRVCCKCSAKGPWSGHTNKADIALDDAVKVWNGNA